MPPYCRCFSAGGFRWLPITGLDQAKPTISSASEKLKILPALNEKLWQKLGCPPLSDSIAACLNLSEKDLVGEQWKPIQDYETLYEISSLERVRKKAAWNSAAGRKIWLPTQIMHLKYERGSLSVGVTQSKTKRFISITRLVYSHFVEAFDITDRHILILGGNDPLQFSASQLRRVTAKEHKQQVHKNRKKLKQ
ncbi:NUMOD4 domain-containing protein [Xanthocytophaga agilis]|uniref:NUMOD4 domain-containing protein n=1 Tax=Xanthocytophaga agilis TaxID=3048010 RepID=A0AAE3RCE2_9BACT|nr:NUMOD4 domain-containing protein [Xanthocytophaga agilis]MDJ1505162.1 NUMOD4 domain-containing protein [Xanthocytophaga agilis]